jgi:2-methylisocitrate lyase-like PEP mutase family enzyme
MMSGFRQTQPSSPDRLRVMGTFETFRELHAPGALLILPNAWDAGTARLVEESGASAIATTSAGLAWAHGYPDGNALPTAVLTAAVAEIARAIRVPLTVDVEAGYSGEPRAVAELIAALVDAGAVGINLEDGADAPDLLCAKIEAVKRAGADFFVNARTDVFLRGLVPIERAADETIARARRYRDAGCDGLFVPYVATSSIRVIADAIDPVPLNVMAVPRLPAVAELRTLGVRRLSAGSALASAALGTVRRVATTFLRDGQSDALFEESVDYSTMNSLLTRAG